MRLAWHAVSMADMRNAYKMLVIRLRGTGHLEDLVLYDKIILKWISKILDFGVWNGLKLIRIGMSGRLL